MEISIKGTQTEKNLLKAFAGESQAARRYRMYAKKGSRGGAPGIASLSDRRPPRPGA